MALACALATLVALALRDVLPGARASSAFAAAAAVAFAAIRATAQCGLARGATGAAALDEACALAMCLPAAALASLSADAELGACSAAQGPDALAALLVRALAFVARLATVVLMAAAPAGCKVRWLIPPAAAAVAAGVSADAGVSPAARAERACALLSAHALACVCHMRMAAMLALVREGRSAQALAEANVLAQLHSVEQQLAKQAREASAGARCRLVRTVMHDLRTPLLSVTSLVESLRDAFVAERTGWYAAAEHPNGGDAPAGPAAEPPASPFHSDFLERLESIDVACELMEAIVADMLEFERLESGNLALCRNTFGLRPLLHGTVELYAAWARKKRISLVVEALPPGLSSCKLYGDLRRLRQCLGHGLSNAIKFSEADTSVTISARLLGRPDDAAAPPRLRISVTDQGMGMTAADVCALNGADPFAHGVMAGQLRGLGGAGLGLSIARRIAALHPGGRLSVSSPGIGRGSTFAMDLDCALGHARRQRRPPLAPTHAPQHAPPLPEEEATVEPSGAHDACAEDAAPSAADAEPASGDAHAHGSEGACERGGEDDDSESSLAATGVHNSPEMNVRIGLDELAPVLHPPSSTAAPAGSRLSAAASRTAMPLARPARRPVRPGGSVFIMSASGAPEIVRQCSSPKEEQLPTPWGHGQSQRGGSTRGSTPTSPRHVAYRPPALQPVGPPTDGGTGSLVPLSSSASSCSAPTDETLLVLHVEDDALLRRALPLRIFNKLGVKYEQAADGEEAVQRVLEAPRRYSLILMDNQVRALRARSDDRACRAQLPRLASSRSHAHDATRHPARAAQMPVMSGANATRKLRSLGYDGVIVGMTGVRTRRPARLRTRRARIRAVPATLPRERTRPCPSPAAAPLRARRRSGGQSGARRLRGRGPERVRGQVEGRDRHHHADTAHQPAGAAQPLAAF